MRTKDAVGAVLFVVGGLAIAGWAGYTIYEERMAIHTAEPVEGTVINSSVATVSGTEPGVIAGHEADVWYRYSYDGRTYTTDVVFPGGDGSAPLSSERAQRIANRYEAGSTLTVYVSTWDPSWSYLIEDTLGDRTQFFFFGMGLLMAYLPVRALRR